MFNQGLASLDHATFAWRIDGNRLTGKALTVKIILTNLTRLDSGALKQLLFLAATKVHCKKNKRVVVRYTRSSICTGRALIGDRHSEASDKRRRLSPEWSSKKLAPIFHNNEPHEVVLYVPQRQFDPSRLAAVAEHEFMHNLGVRHVDMTMQQRRCIQPTPYAEVFRESLFWSSVSEPQIAAGKEDHGQEDTSASRAISG